MNNNSHPNTTYHEVHGFSFQVHKKIILQCEGKHMVILLEIEVLNMMSWLV